MTRSELIELVSRSADDAGLITTDKNAVIAAVSNPSVTRVACGSWFVFDSANEMPCGCPAALGYGLSYNENESRLPLAAHRLAESFDIAVGALDPDSKESQVSIIEIVDE